MTGSERLRCNAIDIGGSNSSDRDRIEKVGFERWLDEVSMQKTAGTPVAGSITMGRDARCAKQCSWQPEPTRGTAVTSANFEVIGVDWPSEVRVRNINENSGLRALAV